MSIITKLHINDSELNIIRFSYAFNQKANVTGFPSSKPTGGEWDIAIETQKEDFFLEKMVRSEMVNYVKIVITAAKLDSKSTTVELRDVYVTEHRNNFNGVDSEPMTTFIRLSPASMVRNGETIFAKYWKITDPNANVTTATATTEEPIPNVISVDWIHPETRETITETKYTEKIALTAQIENPEIDTAKIVITKEDGTEFENGETELTFEEAITEEGTVELTALEIKEQWETFKTTDVDKLVAKIDHNGYQKKSGKLAIAPNVQVIAEFRPTTGWNGEKYGFDWIRLGDSGLSGDTIATKYEKILGHHYITPPGRAQRLANDGEIMKGLSTFVNEPAEFVNYKAALRIPDTHPDYNPAKPDPIIDLVLNVEVVNQPERLKLVYENTYFKISSPGAKIEVDKTDNKISYLVLPNTSKAVGTRKIDIRLKNISTFSQNQTIEVIAEEKQTDGSILDKLVGQVEMIANSKIHRKKTKILLVNVKTNILGPSRFDLDGLVTANEQPVKTMLEKFLNQALIRPEFDVTDLDLRTDAAFNSKYAPSGSFSATVVHAELENAFFYDNPANPTVANPAKTKYKDYFRIYFIGESCGSGDYGEAEAIGSDSSIVYCDGLTDTTAAHELYHSMGLYHTFSNLGSYTFDYGKTDCIMDYSDIVTPALPVIQFYKWQWDKLRGNAKVKNE